MRLRGIVPVVIDVVTLALIAVCISGIERGWFKSHADRLTLGYETVHYGTVGKCFTGNDTKECIRYADFETNGNFTGNNTDANLLGYYYPLLDGTECCKHTLRGLGLGTIIALCLAGLLTIAAIILGIFGILFWNHGFGIAAGLNFVNLILLSASAGMMWGWYYTNADHVVKPEVDYAAVIIFVACITAPAAAVLHLFARKY